MNSGKDLTDKLKLRYAGCELKILGAFSFNYRHSREGGNPDLVFQLY